MADRRLTPATLAPAAPERQVRWTDERDIVVDPKSLARASTGLPREVGALLLVFADQPVVAGDSYVIGHDSVCDLHVDGNSGAVRAIDPSGELPSRYVSSSTKQLAALVRAYARYQRDVSDTRTEDEARAIVERLESELRVVDPLAVETADTWWSIVLEQASHGLL